MTTLARGKAGRSRARSLSSVPMTQRLDRLRRAFYKARPFAVAVACFLAPVARADVVNGAQIPDGAQRVGENRYRAPGDFEDTLKYYRAVYSAGSYPRKSIANQPGVPEA